MAGLRFGVRLLLCALPVACNPTRHDVRPANDDPGVRAEPRVDVGGQGPDGGRMAATSIFARAETHLASSGRRFVATPNEQPRAMHWPAPDGVHFREYRTDPESGLHVLVYAFPTEPEAAAREPEIRKATLDGTRTRTLRKDTVVFVLEAPIGLPGRAEARDANASFDAVVAALTGP